MSNHCVVHWKMYYLNYTSIRKRKSCCPAHPDQVIRISGEWNQEISIFWKFPLLILMYSQVENCCFSPSSNPPLSSPSNSLAYQPKSENCYFLLLQSKLFLFLYNSFFSPAQCPKALPLYTGKGDFLNKSEVKFPSLGKSAILQRQLGQVSVTIKLWRSFLFSFISVIIFNIFSDK